MALRIPSAPSPEENPIAVGTPFERDASLEILGNEVLTGGHPWRMLRLKGARAASSREMLESGVVPPSHQGLARTLVNYGMIHPQHESALSLSDIDVVIPVWNNPDGLETLLRSLEGCAVTVVDDASDLAHVHEEIAQRYGATFLSQPFNAGPAAARNAGARAGSRPFIWFLDSDVSVDDLEASVTVLSRHFSDELVAAVAPRITGRPGHSMLDGFEERHGPLDLGPNRALVAPGGSVSYVPSASLMLRRSALGDGFDETLRTGEDVDFVWRLNQARWLVLYDPSLTLHHEARATLAEWFAQRHGYGRSAGPLATRFPDHLAPLRVDAMTLMAWVFLALRQPTLVATTFRAAQLAMSAKLPDDVEDRDEIARHVVNKGITRSGGPLARNLLRSFLPLLVALLIPRRTRKFAAAVMALGLMERLNIKDLKPYDIPLALLDDAAYSSGVMRSAIETKNWRVLKPRITYSTISLRELLPGGQRFTAINGHKTSTTE